MPIYEYQCRECDHRLEALQGISEPPLTTCTECGGELRKLMSAPAFQFKGSGWYVTDYARKGAGGNGEKAVKGDEGSSSGEGKKAEKEPKESKGKKEASSGSGGTGAKAGADS